MKTALSFRIGFITLAAVALLSGCCRYINCDCEPSPSIGVAYESDSLACPLNFFELVTVTAFDQATNDSIGQPRNLFGDECQLSYGYDANRYWVISSDSLNISDTLRVLDVSFFNSDDDCCDCGPQISNIQIDINGERSAGNAPVRKF